MLIRRTGTGRILLVVVLFAVVILTLRSAIRQDGFLGEVKKEALQRLKEVTDFDAVSSTIDNRIVKEGPLLPDPQNYTDTPLVDEHVYDTIKDWWNLWAPEMHTARPTTPTINIPESAPAIGGKEVEGFRKPYTDLLKLPLHEVDSLTKAHKTLMKALDREPLKTEVFSGGQGYVTVAGGRFFGPVLVSLHLLRESGSTLPMEVFVANKGEYEENTHLCEKVLPKLNARCLVVTDFYYAGAGAALPKVGAYQLKVLAMLFSSFSEFLFVDADSHSLFDAGEHFSSTPFHETGLVIWPDFWVSTEDPHFYHIAGLKDFPKNLPVTGCETGELLLDKRRHLKTLLVAAYYNIYGPDYYYPLLSQGAIGMGDKETFMAAAIAAGAEYYRINTPVAAIGRRHSNGQWQGTAMVQAHPQDDYDIYVNKTDPNAATQAEKDSVRTAFLHANLPKMNAGSLVDDNELFDLQGNGNGQRLRFWGEPDSDNVQKYFRGRDIERDIWRIMVNTGCALAKDVKDWSWRPRMCEKLIKHWHMVFE